jgi:hypothetical protein
MRKVTKPAKVCKKCGSVLKHEEDEAFCDYCKEKIPEDVHLDTTSFFKGDHDLNRTTRNEFCSWNCVFQFLNEFPYNKKRVEFVTLPSINSMAIDFEKDFSLFVEAIKKVLGDKE